MCHVGDLLATPREPAGSRMKAVPWAYLLALSELDSARAPVWFVPVFRQECD